MKIYTQNVDICDVCPKIKYVNDNKIICKGTSRILDLQALQRGVIPDWCPLPDAEEKEKEKK